MENGQKSQEIVLSQQQWFNSLQPPGYNRAKSVSHALIRVSRLALWELSTSRPRTDGTVISCPGPALTTGQLGRDLVTAELLHPAAPRLQASRETQGKGRERIQLWYFAFCLFSVYDQDVLFQLQVTEHKPVMPCRWHLCGKQWKEDKLARKYVVT